MSAQQGAASMPPPPLPSQDPGMEYPVDINAKYVRYSYELSMAIRELGRGIGLITHSWANARMPADQNDKCFGRVIYQPLVTIASLHVALVRMRSSTGMHPMSLPILMNKDLANVPRRPLPHLMSVSHVILATLLVQRFDRIVVYFMNHYKENAPMEEKLSTNARLRRPFFEVVMAIYKTETFKYFISIPAEVEKADIEKLMQIARTEGDRRKKAAVDNESKQFYRVALHGGLTDAQKEVVRFENELDEVDFIHLSWEKDIDHRKKQFPKLNDIFGRIVMSLQRPQLDASQSSQQASSGQPHQQIQQNYGHMISSQVIQGQASQQSRQPTVQQQGRQPSNHPGGPPSVAQGQGPANEAPQQTTHQPLQDLHKSIRQMREAQVKNPLPPQQAQPDISYHPHKIGPHHNPLLHQPIQDTTPDKAKYKRLTLSADEISQGRSFLLHYGLQSKTWEEYHKIKHPTMIPPMGQAWIDSTVPSLRGFRWQ